ncbi:MAG: hypothetical protein U5L76_06180 [Patescibacteria group bacterium]|nr:hypothetical protein [Patescibacteria group bacterium]
MNIKLKNNIKKILGERRIKYVFFILNCSRLSIQRIKKGLINKKMILHKPIKKITEISLPNKEIFFGYYDKTPFSYDNNKILINIANKKYNSKNKPLIIGYYNVRTKKITKLMQTKTWCWQQGCRLQWYKNNNSILYNTLIDNQYGSVIQDINTKKILKKINYPIYDINKSKKIGISVNFSRLERLRPGYGYSNKKDPTKDIRAPKNDGVWKINIEKNSKKLLYSLNYLSKIEPKKSMIDAEHYINHVCFNPSGNRFLFFHLWAKNGRMYSRAFTSDINGKKLFLLTNENFVSHYAWKSNSELCIFAYHNDKGHKYYLYEDLTNKKGVLGENKLNEDGHPTFFSKNKKMITDTYADKQGYQHLLIYDFKKDRIEKLGKFFMHPVINVDYRCDLHPRINKGGDIICIDNLKLNKREIYIIYLK